MNQIRWLSRKAIDETNLSQFPFSLGLVLRPEYTFLTCNMYLCGWDSSMLEILFFFLLKITCGNFKWGKEELKNKWCESNWRSESDTWSQYTNKELEMVGYFVNVLFGLLYMFLFQDILLWIWWYFEWKILFKMCFIFDNQFSIRLDICKCIWIRLDSGYVF